jgi:hypothetical protein
MSAPLFTAALLLSQRNAEKYLLAVSEVGIRVRCK